MPLPSSNMSWPPSELTVVRSKLSEWDAWYRGDPDELSRVYQGASQSRARNRPSQFRGGVTGALARFMWGRPLPEGQSDYRLHIPLAADLCQASADLLYSEAPAFTMTDAGASTATSARLEAYVDDDLVSTLAGGAELGAALGGRYHRVTWDPSLTSRPFLTTVDADAAWPEFRYGRLSAVTFWWVVEQDGGTVWRHVERHELDALGRGLVFYGLFRGTGSNLGEAHGLHEHASTRPVADQVQPDTGLLNVTPTPGLLVAYIPNMTPNRAWRRDTVGRNLGRSDFDELEGLFDSLDEAYTSWMRDLRVAKARLLVPEYMTRSKGPGEGLDFDLDRDVYTTINSAAPEDGDAKITPMQFQIRVDEHQRTTQDLIENILRSAGYSTSTFGEDEDGAATATETNARKGRSLTTRGRKVRHERPALAALVEKMLWVDQSVLGTPGLTPGAVSVDFGPGAQESPLQLAQTVAAMHQAQAASAAVRVRTLHPDWADDKVDAEAAAIVDEYGLGALASPDTFGGWNTPAVPAGPGDDDEGVVDDASAEGAA